jgi:hypothetical protein
VPGGPLGLQNRWAALRVAGGFDSRPPPLTYKNTGPRAPGALLPLGPGMAVESINTEIIRQRGDGRARLQVHGYVRERPKLVGNIRDCCGSIVCSGLAGWYAVDPVHRTRAVRCRA